MAVRQPTLQRLPGKSPLGWYIYVLQFNEGTIKVGLTHSPRQRARAYHSALSPFGILVADRWVSEPHGQAEDNETLLLGFCRAKATQVNSGEYFTGIAFADVIAFAETLPYVPLAPDQPEPDLSNAARWKQVYAIYEERIADGTYAPGSKLPGVMAIVEEFGIAQMTARRVLTELRTAGLAQMQPGIGTFVTKLPTGE